MVPRLRFLKKRLKIRTSLYVPVDGTGASCWQDSQSARPEIELEYMNGEMRELIRLSDVA